MTKIDSSVRHPVNVTVVLANLGTPDEPTRSGVSRFLRPFLSDRRVVELPAWLWKVILNLFVIPLRAGRVAKAYAHIWRNDSPMREILLAQCKLLEQRLENRVQDTVVTVLPGMSYGHPAIESAIAHGLAENTEHLVIVPLFPQYSATSTAPVYDAVFRAIANQRNLPTITLLKDYYDHPLYIKALADSIRDFQTNHGQPEKLLMTFHGIPKSYTDKGDPYAKRCKKTACMVADELGLQSDQWCIGFQSRFGRAEWEQPYTSEVLKCWAKKGVKSVQVVSPAFSADCLETLEELAVENRDLFLQNGGENYAYIPALNTATEHMDLLENLCLSLIIGQMGTVLPQRSNHL